MSIAGFAVRNSVLVNILMISILVIGVFSLIGLPREIMSEVSLNWAMVIAPYRCIGAFAPNCISRRQTNRILEHIGEQTIWPPPLEPKISPRDLSRAEAVEYIPDVDAYVQDPIYPD